MQVTRINPEYQPIGTYTNTRVKGNAESAYRTGDVNLTPANIGAQVAGDYAAASHTHTPSQITGLGTVKTTSPSAVNAANNTWVDVASISLEAGTWFVMFGGAFASNATGMRRIHFGVSSSSGRTSPTQPATSGDQTRMNATLLFTPTATTTYHLYVSQNSGSTLAFYPFVQAVRVK